MKKKLILVFCTLLMSCTLVGCGNFDASRYVQSCLDATFHGEFDDYMELTNATESQARSAYDKLIESEVDSLEQGYTLSDEQKEKFRSLFVDMYKACKYEVGEAVKNDDDSFTVSVTTYKLTVFDGMSDAAESYIKNYYKEHPDTTTDEAYDLILDFLYDYISDNLTAAQYAEPETTNMNVPLTSTSPKVYTLSTDDLQNVVYKLLDVENQ
jgi:hypothetical protein